MKTERGRLYVIEGPDGVGKSTLSALLAEHFRDVGRSCIQLSFPGREPGTLGALVYSLHHDVAAHGIDTITPSALQALHIAAHIDVIERQLIPALQSGTDVVLDRFWWSTAVYGTVDGARHKVVERLIDAERQAWGRNKPSAVFLLRRDAPLGDLARTSHWDSLADAYAALSDAEGGTRINNTGSVSETLEAMIAALSHNHWGKCARHAEESAGSIAVHTRLAPARPTKVLDTYWKFAAERQETFFRRLEGQPPPWTGDPVILAHRFTNAYRASDRVSQHLIREVQYGVADSSAEDFVFRTLLFKLFNRIETWELLEREFGEISWSRYRYEDFDRVLSKAMNDGDRIYSAAYIMPPGGKSFGFSAKHRNHLALLEFMMAEGLVERIGRCRRMQDVFVLLRSFPTIGDFLAYQFSIDLNYGEIIDFNEMDFVIPGPGALDGLRKCFEDPGGLSEPELIRLMADTQESEFERLGISFRSLWGRRLQLIDCQNLFCEVDKYARVAHPESTGKSGRTRIKQRFRASGQVLRVWYPPKWGLNDKIALEPIPIVDAGSGNRSLFDGEWGLTS